MIQNITQLYSSSTFRENLLTSLHLDYSWSPTCFLSVTCWDRGLPSSQERRQPPAESHRRPLTSHFADGRLSPRSARCPSAQCQTPITAWVSAINVSEGLRGGATHRSAFRTFVLLLFIYRVSLPARVWYLKIEGLCEFLTVSVTGPHHVPLLELLLRWSNRNLGNLMLHLSEPFPKS